MTIRIIQPHCYRPIRRVPFLATGRASATVVAVLGECRLLDRRPAPAEPVPGTLWAFHRANGSGDQESCHCWALLFPRCLEAGRYESLENGEYELKITGVTASGLTTPVRKRFRLDLRHESTPQRFTNITIGSHISGTNITDEAEDFVAYGDCTHSLLETNMTRDTTSIGPVQTESDPTFFQFWSAWFPSLSPGEYALTVEDIAHHTDPPVVELQVDILDP